MKEVKKDNSLSIELLEKEMANNFEVTNNLIIQLQNEIILLINLIEKNNIKSEA